MHAAEWSDRSRRLAGVDQALGDGRARAPGELLDQLRERLGRLEANHPSAYGADGPASAPVPASAERGASAELGDSAEGEASPLAEPEEKSEQSAGGPGSAGGSNGGPGGPGGPGGSNGGPGDLPRLDAPGPFEAGDGPPLFDYGRPTGGGDPYRPWFMSGDDGTPWFAE